MTQLTDLELSHGTSLHTLDLVRSLSADLAGIDRLGTDRRLRTWRIDDLPGRPEVDRFCR